MFEEIPRRGSENDLTSSRKDVCLESTWNQPGINMESQGCVSVRCVSGPVEQQRFRSPADVPLSNEAALTEISDLIRFE